MSGRAGYVACFAVSVLVALALGGCSNDDGPVGPPAAQRTYSMGFSGFPPRPDLPTILQTIDMWSTRADVALILTEPPWDSLLVGRAPDSLIRANQLGLANYYRAKGLRVAVSIDPTNGLDRSSDASALVAAGRSISEAAIQHLFRDYAVAMDTLLHPDYLTVASETNLVRALAAVSIYNGIVTAASEAASAVRAHDATVKLATTVQVETAWGKLAGPGGVYQGIAQDRTDFPFIQILGLSSYPYLGGFSDPDSIPIDYYTRLVMSDPIPEMVIEGGWSSDSTSNAASWNKEKQRRYIQRHAQLLDRAGATAWFQITFTDLDVAALGLPPNAAPFAYLGLVDKDFNPKPALSVWDAVFARQKR